ncbi:MAG: hypothetical protein RLN90_06370 [Balneolaceae bacterium]
MMKKIPIVLWIFQLVTALIIAFNLFSLFLYFGALFESVILKNIMGTVFNSIILLAGLYLIIGIWKRNRTARIGTLIYSYGLFFFSLVFFVVACIYYTPAEIETQYRISNIIIYSILGLIILALPISIQKSEKVREYFQ